MNKISILAAAAALALSTVPAVADTTVQSDPFTSTQGLELGGGTGLALGVAAIVVIVAASDT